MAELMIAQADITTLSVDAIVNAANEFMLGGGGVDGAIHDAAGPELLDCCRLIPEITEGVRCPTGGVRLTPGFRLPARFIIHAVGPVWRGGHSGETEALRSCYHNALELASSMELMSLAFPAISCGAFGFPISLASNIAVSTVSSHLSENPFPSTVVLVALEPTILRALEQARRRLPTGSA